MVEQVFAWPGIGSFAIEALITSDYAVVQGFVLTMALMYLLLNLAIDVLYTAIDPRASDIANALKPPSWVHLFGTDNLGRDVFSRVITATRLDLAISVAAVSLSFVAGSVAGACAGYFGGATGKLIGRLTDTIMAFPLFVLAMGIVSALGNTIENIVYTTAVINFPFYARVARAETSSRARRASWRRRASRGNGHERVLFFHMWPNIMPPMMVQISLNMGYAILNAAGLSSSASASGPRPLSGGSWWPRGPSSSSRASGGSPSFPEPL